MGWGCACTGVHEARLRHVWGTFANMVETLVERCGFVGEGTNL